MVDPDTYDNLMHRNLWLHTLPDATTFEGAVEMLRKWDAWDAVPAAVREYLSSPIPREGDGPRGGVPGLEHSHLRRNAPGVQLHPGGAAKGRGARLSDRISSLDGSRPRLRRRARRRRHRRVVENVGEPFEPPCALFS